MISVIVPCRNRFKQLCRCIDSINTAINYAKQQVPSIVIEVIIVNDHSEYGFTSTIKKKYSNCIVIDSDGFGPGCARNLGVERSKGDYLFFTDSDCIVDKAWIYNGYMVFSQIHPIVIQGIPWLFQKDDNPVLGKNEEELYEIMFTKYLSGTKTIMTDSRNLLFHKSITQYIGREIFSEKIDKATAESRVFGEKCNSLGLEVFFSYDIKVFHEDPTDMLYICHQKYRHGSGRVLIWSKKQDFEYISKRYFCIPISKGLPIDYVLPAHTAFLLGFYNNIGDVDERNKFINFLDSVYEAYGRNLNEYVELAGYL